jgi:hypothetical protein
MQKLFEGRSNLLGYIQNEHSHESLDEDAVVQMSESWLIVKKKKKKKKKKKEEEEEEVAAVNERSHLISLK